MKSSRSEGMAVQPYFPEPISVPGSVAEAEYRLRVGFIKQIMVWHGVGWLLIAIAALYAPRFWDPVPAVITLCAGAVSLTLVRRIFGSSLWQRLLDFVFIWPTLWAASGIVQNLAASRLPLWIFAVMLGMLLLYAAVCGRDYSFPAQFVFASLAAIAAGFYRGYILPDERAFTWGAVALAILYAFYVVYDTAAVMRRRRANEAWSGAVDLYRDMLNVTTYSIRIVQHWRRFKPFVR